MEYGREEEIRENLESIHFKIAEAAKRSGRTADEVRLIAVSKTVAIEDINVAISLGATRIGENRVQELRDKISNLLPCERHFIGSLQANKAKYLVKEITLFHALSGQSTLDTLNARCEKENWICPVLVQVHIGEEESKSGVEKADLYEYCDQVMAAKNLELRGFMCVPPPAVGDEAQRYFAQLRNCLTKIQDRYTDQRKIITELSMGMSHDFEEAIAEGATYVRIGTDLFGTRKK